MSNFFVTKPINVPLGQDALSTKDKVAKLVGLRANQIASFALKKQSVDARDKSNVHFVCSYVIECDKTFVKNATPYVEPRDLLSGAALNNLHGKSCVVVGAGPAGLFLARYLSLHGASVTVVERGGDVAERQSAVQRFFQGGSFDENCNVQFGLGGAGTFSDGKLTTGISSALIHTVFREFVRAGAPKDILTSALPHIGTDNLVGVVSNLRDSVKLFGGEFLFDTFVSDLIEQNGRVVGVEAVDREGNTRKIFADCVALCCGHSAREMFHTLVKHDIAMEFKPFAVGLRVEHTRDFIDKTQYGEMFCTHRDLGSASYKLVNNMWARSCYSFCMCPGGVVVCANSEHDSVVVNGMSNFKRDAKNSNSAIVVTVSKQDVEDLGFGSDALAGMRFQQHLERKAYEMGKGGYRAPCQNVCDFVQNRQSKVLDVTPSYPRGVTVANLRELLPKQIGDAIAISLEEFDKRMKGFAHCGILTGVETRTSSPVKILRNATCQSNLSGLFPVGEGAGHAGGIVSSAVDGLKAAQAIEQFLTDVSV